MMSSRLLIADDHPLFREALVSILSPTFPDHVVDQATNYCEAKIALKTNTYKLVFIDLDMPDSTGLGELALLRNLSPMTPLIVVSAHDNPQVVRTCLEYGASGYLQKSSSPEEIRTAVRSVLAGAIVQPDSLTQSDNKPDSTTSTINSLTPSQLKVLLEIGKGKLNKQIAYDLDITEATVKAHITSIFKKLGINNRTQAGLIARSQDSSIPKIK